METPGFIPWPAKLLPHSKFVNPDQDRWSGEKPAWFVPAAGLVTVRGLIARFAKSPRGVKNSKAVLQDLRGLEEALIMAEQAGVRFHVVMLD